MSLLMEPVELVAGLGVTISGFLGILRTKVALWRIPFGLFALTGVFMSLGAALDTAEELGIYHSDQNLISAMLSLGRILLILSIAFLTYLLALLYDRSHINVFMLPKQGFAEMSKRLKRMYGKAGTKHVLYSMGNLARHIRIKEALLGSGISDDSLVNWLPTVYTLFGWGSALEVREYKPGKRIVIRTKNNFEAMNNVGEGHPSCDFTRGLFAGLGKTLSADMDCEAVERRCQSSGDEYCEFEVNLFPKTRM